MLPRPTATALAARTALTALLTGAVLASAPTSAHAETWKHRDATGDVVVFDFEDEADEDGTPAPANRTADIRSVSVRHAARAVRAVVRVRDLRRHDQVATVYLRGPGDRFGGVQLTRVAGRTHVDSFVEVEGTESRCTGARGHLRPGADRFVVVVPTDCLGRPAWVRVAVSYGVVAPDGLGVALDDGLRDGSRRDGGYGRTGWSPRIDVD
ncbi:hypothetical protein [Nocardioides dongxiaopingii]|uniref:hypothetical protein n=1 Tax=Nocardioides dongxiaopingii TaxID=2576036 RepID=UPI0014859D8C|nr:hypothetical protein [Nocardioides dongxiaopingii]